MKTFKKVSAGESFVVALAEDGLYSWGANTDGQIGNGTTDDEYIPVKLNAELENRENILLIYQQEQTSALV